MTKEMRNLKYERKVGSLLSRHGYKFVHETGNKFRLVSKAIPGWFEERILPYKFNSLQGLMDHLLPISPEFAVDYHEEFDNNP